MRTKTQTTPKAAQASKSANHDERPLNITIEGDLARRVREHARAIGFRPTTSAKQFVEWGELTVSNTPEGDEFRMHAGMGLAPRGKRPVFLSKELVDLLETVLKASGVEITASQYVEETIESEAAATVEENGVWQGFPEFIDGSYQLEPGDIHRMEQAVMDWKSRNREFCSKIIARH